jgi:hypothetical protein
MKPEYQNKSAVRTLFPSHGVISRVISYQATYYPTLTTLKVKRSNTHVIQTHNLSSQVIVHLGHRLTLLGINLGCRWQLVLEIDDLLEEVGDLLLP